LIHDWIFRPFAGSNIISRLLTDFYTFYHMRSLGIILIFASILIPLGILNSCAHDELNTTVQRDHLILKAPGPERIENTEEFVFQELPMTHSTSGSVKGKMGTKLKSIGYKAYNTETVFVVELTYNTTPYESLESSVVQVTVNGQALDQQITNRNVAIFSYSLRDLKPGWKTGDIVEWSFIETGSEEPITFSDTYSLAESNDELQFSYLSEKRKN
jgi:hypothetical protein